MEEAVFAVRNVDKSTRKFIQNYALEHDLNTSEALREIVVKAKEHIKEQNKKKYKSFFDTYDTIKFKGPGNLSDRIDEIVYDEEN